MLKIVPAIASGRVSTRYFVMGLSNTLVRPGCNLWGLIVKYPG